MGMFPSCTFPVVMNTRTCCKHLLGVNTCADQRLVWPESGPVGPTVGGMCVAAKHTRRVGSEREGAERDALVPDRGRDGGGQLGGEGQQSVG